MKAFRFRLERVLEWRGARADLERQQLGALVAEEGRLGAEQEQLRAERMNAVPAAAAASALSGADLAAMDAWRAALLRRDAVLADRRRQQQQRIEGQREILLEARREHRLLEKLKARKALAWAAESEKEIAATAEESHLAKRTREASDHPPPAAFRATSSRVHWKSLSPSSYGLARTPGNR